MGSSAIKTVSVFQQGSFPFPKDDIDPKKKDANWSRQWCEAIYAQYVNDRTAIPYARIAEMEELRRYGAGEQDIGKYQNILATETDDGQLEGFMNINWDIFSVMPKFKHIVRAIMEGQDHKIVATAVDPKSSDEKGIKILQKWFKGQFRELINTARQMNGGQPMDEWLPESVHELELYKTIGGLKLAKETEIEEALDYTFYISDWPEIKRKIIDDFADINCAAVKDYTDTYTKKAKIRYVDPLRFIMQYSKSWDHRNSEFAGEIITESISNIRKNCPEVEETELRNLAQFYNGTNGNPSLHSWTLEDLKAGSAGFKYDQFQVDVVDLEWFSVNSKYKTTRKTKFDESYTYDETWGTVHDKPDKKTRVANYKVVYKAKWIIGSDIVYDYGLQYDAPRPGKKEVELSYKFYRLPGRSIVSLAVPNLDQMQLTWLRMQNAIAMSSNRGIAVEYTSLQNMKLGGEKMDPIDILSLRRDTGDLIYKLTTHAGKFNVPGGFRPIQELDGGIGPQLNEFISIFDLNMNFIRDLTGINQIADASNPDPNQSVGGSQMAVAATNNALKPIYAGYVRLKEKSARSCAIRIQLLVKHDKEAYHVYTPVIGSGGVRLLQFDAENIDADYHIKIEAKPTDERKKIIMEAAMVAMQPDREGFIGIQYPEFLMLERMLENGNLKYAESFLAYRQQKNKERQQAIQKENMDLNAKNAQETEKVKAEQEMGVKKFETDEAIRLEQAKAQIQDGINAREHERKKELELLKLSAKQPQI